MATAPGVCEDAEVTDAPAKGAQSPGRTRREHVHPNSRPEDRAELPPGGWRASIAVALAAASLLAGCNGGADVAVAGGSGSGSSSAASSSSGGIPGDVTGTWVNHYFLADGNTVSVPSDFAAGVQVMVQQGGQWATIVGTTATDGSFVVVGVPEGPYLIGGEHGYLQTEERVVDLGADYLGRPDAVQTQGVGTMIAGHLTGLEPWADNDTVTWQSPNSRGEGFLFDGVATGDTGLTGETCLYTGGLVDGEKGDVLYVTQTSSQTEPKGTILEKLVRFASFAAVQQMPGATLDVTGAFTQPATGEAMTVDFHGAEFLALAPAVNPGAIGSLAAMGIDAVPRGATVATLGGGMELFDVESNDDVDLGSVSYAAPFPPSFTQVLYAGSGVSVPYMVPGATMPAFASAEISIVVPRSLAGTGPIVPLLSPVQGTQIDGQDASLPLTGISSTPTLTWNPPAIGKPAGYMVTVHVVTAFQGQSVVGNGAMVTTAARSVTLPPGSVMPGFTYFFQITALATNVDLGKQPFRASPTGASADLLTATATQ
jgi:hypothetical protein